MASMEVLHHCLLEGLWDDWSVMQHDNWTNCHKTVSVGIELNDSLVPSSLVIRNTIGDSLV